MLKNYLKIAFRGLIRNKSYTFINVAGLGLGITTCLIIFLIIRHELSFDTFHPQYNRIFRIVRDARNSSGVEKSNITPYPLGAAFHNDFPDIKKVTQFHYHEQSLVTIDHEKSYVHNILFADSSFFDVFGFEAVSGNPKKELAQPGRVFLSEEYAKKLSKQDTRHLKLDNQIELEVAGIIKTPPSPSHIAFSMIVSLPTLTPAVAEKFLGFSLDQWNLNSAGFTYIVLPEKVTKESLQQRFPAFIKKYYKPEDQERQTYLLQPLSEIHFNTEYSGNLGIASTSESMLVVLGFVALFILVIACVNFINLSTALSMRKSKEVGVRKTLGAHQLQLAFQYFSEAFLVTCIAALISVGFAEWVAPVLGNFLEKDIALNLFHSPPVMLFLVAIVFFTAVLSGLYPSIVLARFNPVKALKSKTPDLGNSSISLRKFLVVLQFFIAQVLIICTLVVSSQIQFFRDKPLGFAKEAVIDVSLPEHKPEMLESFRNKLTAEGHVQEVSFSLGAPISDSNIGTNMHLDEKGETAQYSVGIKPVDIHYKDVYGLELIEGRWFYESEEKLASLEKEKDRRYAFVINETAVKTLGFPFLKEIIGKNIIVGINGISAPVVGVVKDFHTASLRDKMDPVVLFPFPDFYYNAGIKINTGNTAATLKHIEETWSQMFPEYLFEYTFLDQYIGKLYRQEERMFALFEIFAGIAIFIGCLGLYGLVSFLANQKTKEVAIRKTMGASVGQIVALFTKEFVMLVVVAFVFAAPLAWYAMKLWLEGFAYTVEIGWVVFAVGVIFSLFITFITVGYRSLRAAIANPVDALKAD